jgi:predicted translin family RNA/ssDNA-binding protein
MEGISEYSDSYKAGVTDYISGVNDMARELIREVVKAVDDEQQI